MVLSSSDQLPGWSFKVDEFTNAAYRCTGSHADGREVSCEGSDPDEVLVKCKCYAAEIDKELRTAILSKSTRK
jgi:hypothetical protein